jgi:hypothetical protein
MADVNNILEDLREALPSNQVVIAIQLGTTKKKFYTVIVELADTSDEAQHQMRILGITLARTLEQHYHPIGDLPT